MNWLISDIGAVFRHNPKVREMRSQLWTLVVDEENTAVLTCSEDCDLPPVYEQKYEYTDFPVGTWKMYLVERRADDSYGVSRDSMISRREYQEHRKNRSTVWGRWKTLIRWLHRTKKKILFRFG